MDEINIYTYQSIKSTKANKWAYVYILETIKNGEPKTLTGEKKLLKSTTRNAAELITLISALNRITKKCKITVYSDSYYIANALNRHLLDKWVENNWIDAKNKEVANKEEWQKLLILLKANDISVIKNIEPHSYYNWMIKEAEKVESDKSDPDEEKTIRGLTEDSSQSNQYDGHTGDSKGTSENPRQERIRHQIKATKLINIFRSLDKPLKDYSTADIYEMQKCAENLAAELNLYQKYIRKEKE